MSTKDKKEKDLNLTFNPEGVAEEVINAILSNASTAVNGKTKKPKFDKKTGQPTFDEKVTVLVNGTAEKPVTATEAVYYALGSSNVKAYYYNDKLASDIAKTISAGVFNNYNTGKNLTFARGATTTKIYAYGMDVTLFDTTAGNVFVGGYNKYNKKNAAAALQKVEGDSEITVMNSTVKNIYAGGEGDDVYKGDVVVKVYNSKVGKIYAGGKSGAYTEGDLTVIVSNAGNKNASGSNLVFTGAVFGTPADKKSNSWGTTSVIVNDYKGAYKGAFNYVDTVLVSGDSDVTFSGNFKEVDTIAVKGGASATVNKGGAYVYELILTSDSLTNSEVAMLTVGKSIKTIDKVVVTVNDDYANNGVVNLLSWAGYTPKKDEVAVLPNFTVMNENGGYDGNGGVIADYMYSYSFDAHNNLVFSYTGTAFALNRSWVDAEYVTSGNTIVQKPNTGVFVTEEKTFGSADDKVIVDGNYDYSAVEVNLGAGANEIDINKANAANGAFELTVNDNEAKNTVDARTFANDITFLDNGSQATKAVAVVGTVTGNVDFKGSKDATLIVDGAFTGQADFTSVRESAAVKLENGASMNVDQIQAGANEVVVEVADFNTAALNGFNALDYILKEDIYLIPDAEAGADVDYVDYELVLGNNARLEVGTNAYVVEDYNRNILAKVNTSYTVLGSFYSDVMFDGATFVLNNASEDVNARIEAVNGASFFLNNFGKFNGSFDGQYADGNDSITVTELPNRGLKAELNGNFILGGGTDTVSLNGDVKVSADFIKLNSSALNFVIKGGTVDFNGSLSYTMAADFSSKQVSADEAGTAVGVSNNTFNLINATLNIAKDKSIAIGKLVINNSTITGEGSFSVNEIEVTGGKVVLNQDIVQDGPFKLVGDSDLTTWNITAGSITTGAETKLSAYSLTATVAGITIAGYAKIGKTENGVWTAGAVTAAADVSFTGAGEVGAVTAKNGKVDISAAAAKSIITGDVTAEKVADEDGNFAENAGDVNITAADKATVKTGAVKAASDIAIAGEGDIDIKSINAAGALTVNADVAVEGAVEAASINNNTKQGTISAASLKATEGNIRFTEATVTGTDAEFDVDAKGSVEFDKANVTGNIKAGADVVITEGSVDNIKAGGNVALANTDADNIEAGNAVNAEANNREGMTLGNIAASKVSLSAKNAFNEGDYKYEGADEDDQVADVINVGNITAVAGKDDPFTAVDESEGRDGSVTFAGDINAGEINADGAFKASGKMSADLIDAASVKIIGTADIEGIVTANKGNVEVTGAAEAGNVKAVAGDVTLSAAADKTIAVGSIDADGVYDEKGEYVSNGDVTFNGEGTVTAGIVTADGKVESTAANMNVSSIAAAKAVTLHNNIDVDGNISANKGDISITGTADIDGSVTAVEGSVYVTGSAVIGSDTIDGYVKASKGDITLDANGADKEITVGTVDADGIFDEEGKYVSNGKVTFKGEGTVNAGIVTADGAFESTAANMTATSVTGASVAITGAAEVEGAVSAAGNVTADGSLNAASVTGASVEIKGAANVTDAVTATAGDVTLKTDADADAEIIEVGAVTAEKSDATGLFVKPSGNVVIAAADSADSVTADSITADAKVTISGNGSVDAGVVKATGAFKSTAANLAADSITAASVDITGVADVEGAVSAAGNVTADGSLNAASVTGASVAITGAAEVTGAVTANNGTVVLSTDADADAETIEVGSVEANKGTGPFVLPNAGNIEIKALDADDKVTVKGTVDADGNIAFSGNGTVETADVVALGSFDSEVKKLDADSITAASVEVSNNVVVDGAVTATGTDATSGHIIATGNIQAGSIDAKNYVNIAGNADIEGDVKAVNAITFDGKTFDVNNIDAGKAVNVKVADKLTATGYVEGASVKIEGDAEIAGAIKATDSFIDLDGTVSANAIDAEGNVTADGDLTVKTTVNAANVAITGVADIDGTITADQAVTLKTYDDGDLLAEEGELIDVKDIAAGTDVTLTANAFDTVNAGNVDAEGNVVINGNRKGTATVGNVDAEGNVEISDVKIETKNIDAGGYVAIDSDDVTTGSIVAVADVTIDSADATVTGNVSGATVDIDGNAAVSMNVIAKEDIEVEGSLKATQVRAANDVTVNGKLDAYRVTATNGSVDIDGEAIVKENVTAGDSVALTAAANKEIAVTGTVTATAGDVVIDGAGAVKVGAVTAGDDVEITNNNVTTGAITAKGMITVISDNATVNGDINAEESVKLEGDMTVTGNVEGFNADIFAADEITITGNVTADGEEGAASAIGNVNIGGKLSANGIATVKGGATVAGTVEGNNVHVIGSETGAVTANGAFAQIENATINGDITAANGLVDIDGTVSAEDILAGGAVTADGDLTAASVKGASVAITGAATVGTVDDNDVFTGGAVTATATDITVGTDDVDAALTAGAVSAEGNVTTFGTLTAASVEAKTAAVSINGKADIDGTVTAATNVTLNAEDKDIVVDGAVTATAGKVDIDGAVTTANITAGTDVDIDGTVNVNGKVTAGGAVTAEKVILNVTGNEGVAIDAKGNVTLEGQINLGTGSVAGADVSLKAQNDLEFVKAGNITATGEVTVAGNAAAAEVNANVGTITGASAKVSYANTGAITATGDDGVSVMDSTVDGNITAEKGNAVLQGKVSAKEIYAQDNVYAGKIDYDAVDLTAASVKGGNVEIYGNAEITGVVEAELENVKLVTVNDVERQTITAASVKAAKDVVVTAADGADEITISGAVEATAGKIDFNGDGKATVGAVTAEKGSVTASDKIILYAESIKSNGFIADDKAFVKITNGIDAQTGSVEVHGEAILNAASINANNVGIDNVANITGDVTATGTVKVTSPDGVLNANNVSAGEMVDIKGTLEAEGNLSGVAGIDISGTATVKGESVKSEKGAINIGGTLNAANAAVEAAAEVTANDLTAKSVQGTNVVIKTAEVGDFVTATGKDITVTEKLAAKGNVTAKNNIKVGTDVLDASLRAAAVEATEGSVTAYGTVDAASVKAGKDVTVDGTATVGTGEGVGFVGGEVSAGQNINIAGDLTAGAVEATAGAVDVEGDLSAASVTAGTDVTVDGTATVAGDVTAGEDVVISGKADITGSVTATEGTVDIDGAADIRMAVNAKGDVDLSTFDNGVDGREVIKVDTGITSTEGNVTLTGYANDTIEIGQSISAEKGTVSLNGVGLITTEYITANDVVIDSDNAKTGSIDAANDVTIKSEGVKTYAITAGNNVTVDGGLIAEGVVEATAGTVDVDGNLTAEAVKAGTDIIVGGKATVGTGEGVGFVGGEVSAGQNIDIAGDLTAGAVTATAGKVEVDGDLTAASVTATAGAVIVDGTATVTGAVKAGAEVDVYGNLKAASVEGASIYVAKVDAETGKLVTTVGGVTATAGDIKVEAALDAEGAVTATGAVIVGGTLDAASVEGASVNVAGNATVDGNVTTTDGIIWVDGKLVAGGDVYSADYIFAKNLKAASVEAVKEITINGSLDAEGGAVKAGSSILVTAAGAADILKAASIEGSNVRVQALGANKIDADITGHVTATSSFVKFINVDADITGNVTAMTDVSLSGTAAVTGDITAELGQVALDGEVSAANITAAGAVTANGTLSAASVTAGTDVTVVGTATVGTGEGVGFVGGTVTATKGNIDIDGTLTAGAVEATAGAVDVDGDLSAASVTAGTDVTVVGTANVTGAVEATAGAVDVEGDLRAASVTAGTYVDITGDAVISGEFVTAEDGNIKVTGSLDAANADVTAAKGDIVVIPAEDAVVKAESLTAKQVVIGQFSAVDVDITGDVTATEGIVRFTNADANITGAVTATAGAVTATGILNAASVTGASVAITGNSVVEGAVEALTGAVELSTNDDTTADTIKVGSVKAAAGDVTLTTFADDTVIVNGEVQGNNVTLGGAEGTVQVGGAVTAAANLNVNVSEIDFVGKVQADRMSITEGQEFTFNAGAELSEITVLNGAGTDEAVINVKNEDVSFAVVGVQEDAAFALNLNERTVKGDASLENNASFSISDGYFNGRITEAGSGAVVTLKNAIVDVIVFSGSTLNVDTQAEVYELMFNSELTIAGIGDDIASLTVGNELDGDILNVEGKIKINAVINSVTDLNVAEDAYVNFAGDVTAANISVGANAVVGFADVTGDITAADATITAANLTGSVGGTASLNILGSWTNDAADSLTANSIDIDNQVTDINGSITALNGLLAIDGAGFTVYGDLSVTNGDMWVNGGKVAGNVSVTADEKAEASFEVADNYANTITVNGAGVTLDITGDLTGATLNVTDATLNIGGLVDLDEETGDIAAKDLNGGSFNIGGDYVGNYDNADGDLTVAGNYFGAYTAGSLVKGTVNAKNFTVAGEGGAETQAAIDEHFANLKDAVNETHKLTLKVYDDVAAKYADGLVYGDVTVAETFSTDKLFVGTVTGGTAITFAKDAAAALDNVIETDPGVGMDLAWSTAYEDLTLIDAADAVVNAAGSVYGRVDHYVNNEYIEEIDGDDVRKTVTIVNGVTINAKDVAVTGEFYGNITATGAVVLGGDIVGGMREYEGKWPTYPAGPVTPDYDTAVIEAGTFENTEETALIHADITANGADTAEKAALITVATVNGDVEATAGSVDVKSVTGDVTAKKNATVVGNVGGFVEATEGLAKVTGNVDETVTGASVEVTGNVGVEDDLLSPLVDKVTATEGDATVNGIVYGNVSAVETANVLGTVHGDVDAKNANVGNETADATVNGSVTADENAVVYGTVGVADDLLSPLVDKVTATAGNATVDGTVYGNVAAANGTATLAEGTVYGDISGKMVNVNGTVGSDTIASDVIATGEDTDEAFAAVVDGTVYGSVFANEGSASVLGTVKGSVDAKIDANVGTEDENATVDGSVTATDGAAIVYGNVGVNVSAGTDATVYGNVIGNIDAYNGTATLFGEAAFIDAKNIVVGNADDTDNIVHNDATATESAVIYGNVNGSVTAGTEATVKGTVGFNVEAGNSAIVTGDVGGNVVVTNGDATVTGDVTGNIQALNGTATLFGEAAFIDAKNIVVGNADDTDNIVHNDATATESAVIYGTVGGSVTAGTDATVTGDVGGNVKATAGAATVNGTVTGDVTAGTDATVIGGAANVIANNAYVGNADNKVNTIGNDVIANETAVVYGTVGGNVEAAAGAATVNGTVTGDVTAGTDATVIGTVGGSVTAATGAAYVEGSVAGNVTAAGAATVIGTGDVVDSIEGTTVTVTGNVKGSVVATAGDAAVSGTVGFDVTAAGTATLGGNVGGAVTAETVVKGEGAAIDSIVGDVTANEIYLADVAVGGVTAGAGSYDSMTGKVEITESAGDVIVGDITAGNFAYYGDGFDDDYTDINETDYEITVGNYDFAGGVIDFYISPGYTNLSKALVIEASFDSINANALQFFANDKIYQEGEYGEYLVTPELALTVAGDVALNVLSSPAVGNINIVADGDVAITNVAGEGNIAITADTISIDSNATLNGTLTLTADAVAFASVTLKEGDKVTAATVTADTLTFVGDAALSDYFVDVTTFAVDTIVADTLAIDSELTLSTALNISGDLTVDSAVTGAAVTLTKDGAVFNGSAAVQEVIFKSNGTVAQINGGKVSGTDDANAITFEAATDATMSAGDVDLAQGNDTLTFASATACGALDGGDGVDTLNVNSAVSASGVTDFESVVFGVEGSLVIDGTGAGANFDLSVVDITFAEKGKGTLTGATISNADFVTVGGVNWAWDAVESAFVNGSDKLVYNEEDKTLTWNIA